MKKIIIPFMFALTSSMANAEYLIKIPLEQAQGGHLPNGSIILGAGVTQPAPEVEPTPEIPPSDKKCFPYTSEGVYFWREDDAVAAGQFYLSLMYWKEKGYSINRGYNGYSPSINRDQTIYNGRVHDGEIILEGYKYTRYGEMIKIYGTDDHFYGVCRESITP